MRECKVGERMKKAFKIVILALVAVPMLFISTACDIFGEPPRRIEWIQIVSTDHKTEFKYGEDISFENLRINVCFSDTEIITLPYTDELFTVTGYRATVSGTHVLTVTYTDPVSGKTGSTTYKVTVGKKLESTVKYYEPGTYYLGDWPYDYSGLRKAAGELAVATDVKGDNETRARIVVASNIAGIMAKLFESGNNGVTHDFMSPAGYSHGGYTTAHYAPQAYDIGSMKANALNAAGTGNYARYVRTKTERQESSLPAGISSRFVEEAERPYSMAEATTGEKFFMVVGENSTNYYIHHYYDNADFDGFKTLKIPSGFDSETEKEYVYTRENGLVRNRDLFCDKDNKTCGWDAANGMWDLANVTCPNPSHRGKYVQGYSDKLAQKAFEVFGRIVIGQSNSSIQTELSNAFADVTVDHFKDYFESRYTSIERNGTGRFNAVVALKEVFNKRFNASGTVGGVNLRIGDIVQLINNEKSILDKNGQASMSAIASSVLSDAAAMFLTVEKHSETTGNMELKVGGQGGRAVFCPMGCECNVSMQPYEILDSGTLSFTNYMLMSNVTMDIRPEGLGYRIKFAFAKGTATPRSLGDILFVEYGSSVNVNSFAPITRVLAEQGFSIFMRPKT